MDYIKMAESIALCGKSHDIDKCKSGCIYYSGNDMNKCIPKMTADCADAIIKLYYENQALYCGLSPIRLDENSAKSMELAIEVSELSQMLKEEKRRNAEVKKERDAAIQQLHGYCPACKSYTPNHNEGPCEECKHEYFQYQNPLAKDNWKWNGGDKQGPMQGEFDGEM